VNAQGRVCERCGDVFLTIGLGITGRIYLCAPCHNGAPPQYRGPLGPHLIGLIVGSG
jgi:hypothetical protein